jgi:hypothetical protein
MAIYAQSYFQSVSTVQTILGCECTKQAKYAVFSPISLATKYDKNHGILDCVVKAKYFETSVLFYSDLANKHFGVHSFCIQIKP